MDTSAAHIIAKCGGPQVVADMLGIDLATVHKWKYPRSRGGTDGRIPTGRQTELLRLARAAGVDLTPSDFFSSSDALDVPQAGGGEPVPDNPPPGFPRVAPSLHPATPKTGKAA